MAVTTEPPWVNKNQGTAARNGTSAHTIGASGAAVTPSSGCVLNFTPTAGRAIAVFVAGSVTHTSSGSGAGSGWTERQQPVDSAELSLFTKDSAAGNDFLTLTHNGPDYPIAWCWIEFPAGTTYTTSTGATGTPLTYPALTGLPGTDQVVFAAFCAGVTHTTGTLPSGTVSAPWVEDADLATFRIGTDGAFLYVQHQLNVTAISITPTFTFTPGSSPQGDRQKIVAAWNVAAIGGGGTSYPASGTVVATSTTEGAATSRLPAAGTVTAVAATSGDMAARLATSGTVTATSTTSGSAGVLPKLLGQWGFANNLTDSSGNGHDGTFAANGGAGGLTYVDGPLPSTRAVVFGNELHAINLGRTGLEPPTNGVTTMGWMRLPTGLSAGQVFTLLCKARAASSSRSRIGIQGGGAPDWAVRWSDDLHFASGGATLTAGQWHHLAMVDGPNSWAVYVNGTSLAGAARSAGAGIWENYPWTIGRSTDVSDQWAADGMAVSMVRIFDGELTQAEVQTWKGTPVEAGGGGTTYEASGTVAAVSDASGQMTTRLPAAGTTAATSTTSGSLGLARPASGSADALSATSGSANALLPASGTVAATSTTAGAATALLPASGVVAAVSATEGSATTLLPASGTVAAVSGTSGSATPVGSSSGTAEAVSTTSGSMTARLGASGTVAATSGTSGTAGVLRPAAGTVTATSGTSGAMTARLPAAGTVDAVSGTSGSADIPGGMSGTVLAVSATSGAMTLRAAVSGTVAVVSVTTGAIAARLGAAGTVTTVSVVSGQAGVIRAGVAPSNTRVWDGSAWIPARPYVWDGSAWQPRTFR